MWTNFLSNSVVHVCFVRFFLKTIFIGEVSAENSSPIMDQPSMSDDEDSRHPDNDMTEGGVVG